MIITRKFGKILRGEATPLQLMLAALIGTMTGFMPGFTQAPGLLAALFLATVILNANLALIGLCLLLGKVLSVILLPVSFAVGSFLLDGPTEPIFRFLVNAPVLALFGFEYYVTTGGLVLGAVIGAILGIASVAMVGAFRRKMAGLQKGSEKWNQFCARPYAKVLTFIFVGGSRGKTSYEDLLNRKGNGSPIRPMGIVFATLVLVCGSAIGLLVSDEIIAYSLRSGLEKSNGATVDLRSAELQLREGRLVISGLAIADPRALHTDLFRAEVIEADIAQADLLRKRIHIENMRVQSASSGEKRQKQGFLIRPLPELPPPAETGTDKTFEDYLREAEKWKDRLAQVADWLDRMSGSDEEEAEGAPVQRIPEGGLRYAVATHLIEGAPTLLVTRAAVEKMTVVHFGEETLDIVAENFSTHPALVEKAPRFAVRSSAGTFLADASFGAFSRNPATNTMEFTYLNLPVDKIAGGLRFNSQTPIQGGSLDVRGSGNWSSRMIDLPLQVTLRDSRLALDNVGETNIEQLVLPIGVDGPLRNPRIHFSDGAMADALKAAGKAELARRVQGETDRFRAQAEEKVGNEVMERTRGLLEGRLPVRPKSDL